MTVYECLPKKPSENKKKDISHLKKLLIKYTKRDSYDWKDRGGCASEEFLFQGMMTMAQMILDEIKEIEKE